MISCCWTRAISRRLIGLAPARGGVAVVAEGAGAGVAGPAAGTGSKVGAEVAAGAGAGSGGGVNRPEGCGGGGAALVDCPQTKVAGVRRKRVRPKKRFMAEIEKWFTNLAPIQGRKAGLGPYPAAAAPAGLPLRVRR